MKTLTQLNLEIIFKDLELDFMTVNWFNVIHLNYCGKKEHQKNPKKNKTITKGFKTAIVC